MIINASQQVMNSTQEILDIHIEFDPSNEQEEGLAAIIAALCDSFQRLNALEKTVDLYEKATK